MKILAIESSCDDSGIAILEDSPEINQPKILANLVSSQIKIHAKWGGVVPMLAKREHQKNFVPLLKKALQEMTNDKFPISNKILSPKQIQGLKEILEREPELLKKLLPFLKKYQQPDVDYIAVTNGPGLEPALWVGVNLAKALSFIWNLPILPINHIEGHITANSVNDGISGMTNDKFPMTKNLPAMCLVVSGGHTQLILIKKIGEYEIIGETRDDAAGEAFDKVAKMLGLGYPGGPAISRLAEKWNDQFPRPQRLSQPACQAERGGQGAALAGAAITNNQMNLKSESQIDCPITKSLNHSPPKADPPQVGITTPFSFPRPMMNSGNFDFSFSGLKTAVLYTLQKMTKAQIKKSTPAIAAAFQQAVIDVLVQKTINSAKKYNVKSIWLAGGVAANQALRYSLEKTAQENNFSFMVPPNSYCADNAGMIALAAFYQLKQNHAKEISWRDLKAEPNLRIS